MTVLRVIGFALAMAGLSACGQSNVSTLVPSFLQSGEKPLPDAMQRSVAPREVIVSDKSFVVEGPNGYCPDIRSISDNRGRSFVALAACSRMKAGDSDPSVPALLTISIKGPNKTNLVTGAETEFVDFLNSNAGRTTLARSGNAANVSVEGAFKDGRAVYARVTDTSAGQPDGTSQETWRGFFDLNGRLISITAYPIASEPFGNDDGLRLLQSFELRLRAKNPQNATKTGT